jgi:hypothetical protein
MSKNDGGPAFPHEGRDNGPGNIKGWPHDGMSLRDWFAGQALSNPALCTGEAMDWQLSVWFGKDSIGIRRDEIASKQAFVYADAMLKARKQQ